MTFGINSDGLYLGKPAPVYDPMIELGSALIEEWWAGSGITLAGSKVSSWAGRKTGMILAQSTDAYRPSFNNTILNGNPGVTADGLDDYLESSGTGPLPVGSNPVEMWVFLRQTTPAAETGPKTVLAYGNSINNVRRIYRNSNGTNNRVTLQIGKGTSQSSTTNATVDFSGPLVVRAIVTSTQSRIRVLGEADPTPLSAIPSTATDRLRLFAASAPTAAALGDATINRVLFTELLTDPQATALLEFGKAQVGYTE